jgi:hypothetical protein
MSALTRFFFRNEVQVRSTAEVIGWWEARRLPFNIAVGSTGLVTLAATQFILWVPPGTTMIPIVPALLIPAAYGFMANLCYTGGWIVELWLRKLFGREMDPVGPALFRYGFVFSIGLTLFPIAIISLAKVTLILRTLFQG